jgi:hypothetical protein
MLMSFRHHFRRGWVTLRKTRDKISRDLWYFEGSTPMRGGERSDNEAGTSGTMKYGSVAGSS